MVSSNAEKAWAEYAPTLPGMLRPAEVNALRPHFVAGRASRDAEVAELTRLLAESRARFADSEARRAELESVIAEALNAMTHGWAARKSLDVVHAILHSKPSVVLEDRDREVAARALEAITSWRYEDAGHDTSDPRGGVYFLPWQIRRITKRAAAIRKGDTNV